MQSLAAAATGQMLLGHPMINEARAVSGLPVSLSKVGVGEVLAGLDEHLRRGVDADHAVAGLSGWTVCRPVP